MNTFCIVKLPVKDIIYLYILRQCKPNSIMQSRTFSTTSCFLSPVKNDQEKLFDEVNELEKEYNSIDKDIEGLTSKIKENSQDVEVSKCIDEWEVVKDKLVEKFEEDQDEALTCDGDERKARALLVDLVKESSDNDLTSLAALRDELTDSHENSDEVIALMSRLQDQKFKSDQLAEKFEENTLPPIQSSQESSFPQDSSDVQQTEFNSFEPFGDD